MAVILAVLLGFAAAFDKPLTALFADFLLFDTPAPTVEFRRFLSFRLVTVLEVSDLESSRALGRLGGILMAREGQVFRVGLLKQ